MTGDAATLPTGFAALEPFVAGWAVSGSDARMRRRLETTHFERLAFYEAARPLLASAMDLLDQRSLDGLDPAERRLLDLMLGLAHVSLAIEHFGESEAEHAVSHKLFHISRSTAG